MERYLGIAEPPTHMCNKKNTRALYSAEAKGPRGQVLTGVHVKTRETQSKPALARHTSKMLFFQFYIMINTFIGQNSESFISHEGRVLLSFHYFV